MTYTFHTDIGPQELDTFVENSDQNSLFQCHQWADVKNNWKHAFTGVRENGELVAAALVLIRPLPLGKTLMYIPRGPVMDYHYYDLVRFFLDSQKAFAKKKHAIVLRFDPNLLSRIYPYSEKDKDHPMQNTDIVAMLKAYGASHKGYTTNIHESTQPRFNAASHFGDDYFSHLDKKTRASIRTAERKGAELYEGHEYISEFAQAMQETEARKGVALRNEEYFRNMMEVYGDHCIIMVAKLNFKKQIGFLETELAELEQKMQTEKSQKILKQLEQKMNNDRKDLDFLLEEQKKENKDEVILAGQLAIYNKNRMEYVYMGNNASYLRIRASYLLYKAFFDRCVELGIHYVSMGGIEGTLDDGLTQFKSSWLMEVEEYIGEFNIVLDPVMYYSFEKLYPQAVKLLVKLRK